MDFEKLWQAQAQEKKMGDAQKFWDKRAPEFNEIGKITNDEVVDYLYQKGVIFEGAKVLDIGCGAGRHSKAFLGLGCQVTGIDISPAMIDFTKENTQDFASDRATFKVLPWDQADLAQEGWENEFDLVFASMSPAIDGPEALKKMIKASRNYCYMSSHLIKRDALGETLKQVLKRDKGEDIQRKTLYYAFNILWQLGYLPEFHHQDHDREKTRDIETAQNYYQQTLQVDDQETKKKMWDYFVEISENGIIKDHYQSKTGWLLWSVKK